MKSERAETDVRAAAELKANEYHALLQSKLIGFVVADFTGRIVDANDEYLRIVGYDRAELEQGLVEWRHVTPPEWLPADDAAIDQLRRLGYMAPYLKEYQRRDGVRVPVVLGATLLDRGRERCVCFVLDDTLRRKAETMLADANRSLERRVRNRTASLKASESRAKRSALALAASERNLRTLAAHLQTVREDERTQLAREIHDVLGQSLTVLKMDVAWLGRHPPSTARGNDGALAGRLAAMSKMIDEVINQVRRLAAQLRPGVLDDLGLAAAIEWQTRDFTQRSGLDCTFESNIPEARFERDVSTAMFRILQETLTNVARHAHAQRVDVSLVENEGHLRLRVRDDGAGMSPDASARGGSLGLLGMHERARRLGGQVSVTSSPGAGTQILVDVPLRAPVAG